REFELTGDDALVKESERWLKREKAVIAGVDHALYFSDVEVAEINALLPEADARAIPLYTLEPQPVARAATEHPELLFVAGFNHPPNIDAADWLVSNILPLIQDRVPDVRLHIAGSNPSRAVLDLASDSVTVHGYVSDERLLELYGRACCAVVPLRFGAGVKGKVLEAIQYGVPLVTTAVGAEGIPDAQDIMAIGRDEAGIADRVVDAIQSQSSAGDAHGSWLEHYFSPARARAMLQAVVAQRD
ncbi:MAG: glycosyltransferase family 4 protein, partial [Cellvibrionales bacterium]